MRQGRESEATEAIFCLQAKKPFHTGVRTGCQCLISLSIYLSVCLSVCLPACLFVCLSVCLSVCLTVYLSVSVCVTFVVFTDCESCARPISTNSGSMEASEYGLTRGTCFVASRLEVVAVAGMLWISWCVLGAVGFRVFFSPDY